MIEALFSVFQDHIDEAQDVVANDTQVEWAIPIVKENLAKRHFSGR
jgi:hypothetical protein